MAQFRPNQPVETEASEVEVTVSPASPLPAGRHQFQLVVVDDSGNESEPAVLEVIVRDATKPTAVIDGPRLVDVGRSFQLSGRRSADAGGSIVKYRWTLLA
jgi:hypothetical protein